MTKIHRPPGRSARLRTLTAGALAEMRALIFELRPGALAEEGLVSALRRQAAAISAREGVQISVEGPEERLALSPAAEEHCYRLVLEAWHNTVKHADATVTTIIDATAGPSPSGSAMRPRLRQRCRPARSLGLQTMRERAAAAGAAFDLSARRGRARPSACGCPHGPSNRPPTTADARRRFRA